MVVEELQPQRSLKHSPLFQTMMSAQSSRRETLTLPDLTLSMAGAPAETTKFALALTARETPRGLVLRFEYGAG
jgi:hypothetical protein